MSRTSGKQPIEGTIYLSQALSSYGNGTSEGTKIAVYLKGFGPAFDVRQKGFHVHENGDLDRACLNAGGHYNPFNKSHGAPTDAERHVGDLGNVNVTIDGTVSVTIYDIQISLVGPYSVMHRAIVVHENPDDLGLGSFDDSKVTGHAGERLGCCLIEESTSEFNINDQHSQSNNNDQHSQSSLALTSHRPCWAVIQLTTFLSLFVSFVLKFF